MSNEFSITKMGLAYLMGFLFIMSRKRFGNQEIGNKNEKSVGEIDIVLGDLCESGTRSYVRFHVRSCVKVVYDTII